MDRVKIAKLITDLRKEKNLLQNDVAEIFCVSPQAVSKWERGESLPDIESMERICRFYNISLDEFMQGERTVRIDKQEIKNDNALDEEIPKSNVLGKQLFTACYGIGFFILNLIFLALPTVYGINTFNIIFSSNYQEGNYIYMLTFLISIAILVLSIIIMCSKNKVVMKRCHIARIVLAGIMVLISIISWIFIIFSFVQFLFILLYLAYLLTNIFWVKPNKLTYFA